MAKGASNYTDMYSFSELDALKMLDTLINVPKDRRHAPLHYDDYIDVPSRKNADSYNIRIGDSLFRLPPEFIQVRTLSGSTSASSLRQVDSVKLNSGHAKKIIDISIPFNGYKDVNGYAMTGPTGTYYMDGLRSLIAQFRCTPFLPVINEHLNDIHDIYAVALSAIAINTTKDFPSLLTANITLYEFNIEPFMEVPKNIYSGIIDWDLFRYYYQRLLDDNYYVARPLKKVSKYFGDNKYTIKILNEDSIQQYECDEKKIEYSTKAMNLASLTTFDTVLDNNSGLHLTGLTFGFSNMLSELQLPKHENPVYQYIGGMDTTFIFNFETKNHDVIKTLKYLVSKTQQLSRDYRKVKGVGYMKFENELVQMMGNDYLIIQSVNINTVPGFPDLYMINIEAQGFNMDQQQAQIFKKFRPFEDDAKYGRIGRKGTIDDAIENTTIGLKRKIYQDSIVESKLSMLNLYPDLQLPTYVEVDAALELIKKFRTKNNLTPIPYSQYPKPDGFDLDPCVYVDPDFYVFYPVKYMSTDKDTLDDVKSSWPKQIGTTTIDHEEFGKPYIELSQMYSKIDKTNENGFYIERSFVNEKLYGCRGRLLRAFPTFLFMILDHGGEWLDGRKLWTNYYIYNGVMDIAIHGSEEQPAKTASVTLLNMYQNLTERPSTKSVDKYLKKDSWSYRMFGVHLGTPKLTQEMIDIKNILYENIQLQAGARVHIRLGYGNNASLLNTCFTGTISDMSAGEAISLVAINDGIELTNNPVETKEGKTSHPLNLGEEASNLISNLLTDRSNWFVETFMKKGGRLIWCESSKYGIENFGIYLSEYYTESSSGFLSTYTDNGVGGDSKDIVSYAKSFIGCPYLWGASGEVVTSQTLQTLKSTHGASNYTKIKESNVLNKRCFDCSGLVLYVYKKFGYTLPRTTYTQVNQGISISGNYQAGDLVFFGKTAATTSHVGIYVGNGEYIHAPSSGDYVKISKLSGRSDLVAVRRIITTNSKSNISNLSEEEEINNSLSRMPQTDTVKDSTTYSPYKHGVKQYDIVKNIFLANYSGMRLVDRYMTGSTFADGEKNFRLQLTNQLPWDLMQSTAQIHPGYICYPIEHQFEHRLFFGLPQWPVRYKYRQVGNQIYEYSKPMAQWHLASSLTDIISNTIETDSRGMFTNCVCVYSIDGSPKTTPVIYADKTIDWSKQRTGTIETKVFQNLPMLDWIADKFFNCEPGERAAISTAVSNIMISLGKMYTGSITVLGNAGINPYDYILLQDSYEDMEGMCGVREVVHHFSLSTGFVTEITPKLLTESNLDGAGTGALINNGTKLISCFGLFMALRTIGLISMSNMRKVIPTVTKITGGVKTLRTAWTHRDVVWATMKEVRSGRAALKAGNSYSAVSDVIKTIPQKDIGAIKTVSSIVTKSTDDVLAGVAKTFGKITPGLATIAVSLIASAVFDVLIDSISDYFNYQNCVRAYPLLQEGRPLLSGVTGYTKLVPGYSDKAYDSIEGLLPPLEENLTTDSVIDKPILVPPSGDIIFDWNPDDLYKAETIKTIFKLSDGQEPGKTEYEEYIIEKAIEVERQIFGEHGYAKGIMWPSLTLAQAIYEGGAPGSGQMWLSKDHNNFFGIKYWKNSSNPGAIGYVTRPRDGATFCKFKSPISGIYWRRHRLTIGRYSDYKVSTQDSPLTQLTQLLKAGYLTGNKVSTLSSSDIKYRDAVIKIILTKNLKTLDEKFAMQLGVLEMYDKNWHRKV